MDWLLEFLNQANRGDLKTSHYLKEYRSVKVKVSFGQGVLAKVPWISFIAPGMSTSNGYYPVYLYFRDEKKLLLCFGVSETNQHEKSWRDELIGGAIKISEALPSAPRYRDSWVFKTYDVQSDGATVHLTFNDQAIVPETLEADLDALLRLYAENLDQSIQEKDSSISTGLFYLEKQLEDFLIENWNHLDLGEKYDLIYEEGVLKSQQYKTPIGSIDILAKDKLTGNYVVFELKRNQTSDDTMGQVCRYMGWVAENLNNPEVRGIIIAGKYDEKLYYAQSQVQKVDVYLYEVSFHLQPHARNPI